MVDFSALISRIEAAVYENGVQAITGQILQDCLKDVVNTINVQKQDGIYHITVTVDGTSGTPSGTARMDDETYTLELSFSGLKGEVGPAGPQGVKGDKGDTGERGLQGPTGATGAQGPIGPVGPQGIQGERGPAGTNGEDGVGITDIRQTSTSEEAYGQNVVTITLSDGTSKSFVVRNGGAGPQGATGPQGVKGDTGAAGADGISITDVEQIASPSGSGAANIVRITRSNGVATDVTVRNGQQGETGPQGPQGPAGTDATVTRSSINTALGYVPPSPEDAKDVMWAQYGTDTPAAIHAAVEDEKIVRVLWANNICELVEDDWADRTYKFACIDPTTTELIVLTCTNNGWTNTTVPIAGGTDIDTVNVTVDNNTGTPSATGSVSGNTLTLAFHNLKGATGPQGPKGDTGAQGPKGDQGDPGSSIDYPFTLVNNLNSTDSTKALAAPQGKALAQDLSDFKLLVKANINTLMNAMANMAFTGERPTLDWGSLDAHVIRDFTNPSGITLTDNAVGGLISFGTAYSGTLSANSGYVLSNVSVTMAGGGTITYNSSTGAIASSSVTGDITIVATATFDYNSLGYTQDGLVFALDGIYKGGNANAWTDLIGGEMFENHGAVANANHWAFDGTDDYLGGWGETELDFDPADCTIEVAFRSDSSTVQGAGFICHLANQKTSTLNCVHVNVIPGYINGVYLNGTSNVWAWSYITTNCVLALNGARGYANSTALSSLGSNHWTGNYQGRYIGTTTDYTKSTPTFNKGFFRGEIYAIRIYNRQLTEVEMKADQANDNTRFNLGLSL